MTVGAHLLGILHRGFWPSLTGGWVYDRRHSPLCNTVHLYLFIVFFTLPILLHIAEVTYSLAVIYIGFIFVLFGAMKLVIWKINKFFDTADPVIVEELKKEKRAKPSPVGHVTGELAEAMWPLASVLDEPTNAIQSASIAAELGGSTSAGNTSFGMGGRDVSIGPASNRGSNSGIAAVQDNDQIAHSGTGVKDTITVDVHFPGDAPSQSAERFPFTGQLGGTDVGGATSAHMRCSSDAAIDSRRKRASRGTYRSRSGEVASSDETAALVRPSRPAARAPLQHQSSSSGALDGVRRARSSVETAAAASNAAETVLSQRTLAQCRRRGRNSFPNKADSCDGENMFALRSTSGRSHIGRSYSSEAASSCYELGSAVQVGVVRRAASIGAETYVDAQLPSVSFGSGDHEDPSTRLRRKSDLMRSLRPKLHALRAQTSARDLREQDDGETHCAASASQLAGVDERAAGSPSAQPRKAATHGDVRKYAEASSHLGEQGVSPGGDLNLNNDFRVADGLAAGVSEEDAGFKANLLKLLEQLVHTHPEAADVIETVRSQVRSALDANAPITNTSARGGPSQHGDIESLGAGARGQDDDSSDDDAGGGDAEDEEDDDADRPGPSSRQRVARQRRRRAKKGSDQSERESGDECDETGAGRMHLAHSPGDTSEGALHYFQDEQNRWWMYTFDPQGAGTAKLLGDIDEMVVTQPAAAAERKTPTNDCESHEATLIEALRDYDPVPWPEKTARRPEHPFNRGISDCHRRRGASVNSAGDNEGSTAATNGSAPQTITAASAIEPGSQSDEEVAEQRVFAAPTAVFHPSSGTHVVRDMDGSGSATQPSAISSYMQRLRSQEPRRSVESMSGRRSAERTGSTGAGTRPAANPATMAAMPGSYNAEFLVQQIERIMSLAGGRAAGRHLIGEQGNDIEMSALPPSIIPSSTVIGGAESSTATGAAVGSSIPPALTPADIWPLPGAYLSPGAHNRQLRWGRIELNDVGELNLPPMPMVLKKRRHSVRKRYYYDVKYFPQWLGKHLPKTWADCQFKWKCDRLKLHTMFDRNTSVWSLWADVVLASLVAVCTCLVLARGFYANLSAGLFAFVVAGAQFSLVKSVQPDAASPTHGYNWRTAYGRPVYLCLMVVTVVAIDCALKWIGELDVLEDKYPLRFLILWLRSAPGGVSGNKLGTIMLWHCQQLLLGLCLAAPLLFTFGLLPQLDTFFMHCIEQVDMNLFGGTAAFSLLSSLFCLARSLLPTAGLFALCHTALADGSAASAMGRPPLFSLFVSCVVCASYVLSRASSSPRLLWCLVCPRSSAAMNAATASGANTLDSTGSGCDAAGRTVHGVTNVSPKLGLSHADCALADTSETDPLPGTLPATLSARLKHDLLVALLLLALCFGTHSSTLFVIGQPAVTNVILAMLCVIATINHYFIPQMRKNTPWLLFAGPLLKTYEQDKFEADGPARITRFERFYLYSGFIERNLLYPLLVMSALTQFAIGKHLSRFWLSVFLPVAGVRIARGAYCNASQLLPPLLFAALYVAADSAKNNTPVLPMLLAGAVCWPKVREFHRKLSLVAAYMAPWQITWGSAFHVFAQPFSIPHSVATIAICAISSVISAPLNPLLGSCFFLMSYVRPVKFWEKDYNTRRVDNSNMRLSHQFDRGPITDDSSFNALFYEHLTRALQHALAGDVALGRWASNVAAGDCFILASFSLNCLVHIVEVGNGFVTFQLRGLEFRGTYCQQREVEAISEDALEVNGCCCDPSGRLKGVLSFNTACQLRWLAWEVTATKYVVQGYSITDNTAVPMLVVHELRRLLITLYVKCTIYYAIMSPRLNDWLTNETIVDALQPIIDSESYIDYDAAFNVSNDEDYSVGKGGLSKSSFIDYYADWIKYCVARRHALTSPLAERLVSSTADGVEPAPALNALLYALSLLARRLLATAAHNRHSTAAENFLYGVHALFKGDFRVTSSRDEWVFADMDLLRCVIAPAIRMSVKLHQDHFADGDEHERPSALFDRIWAVDARWFISHEQDAQWRRAVLANTPALLALRHVVIHDDGTDDYKVIMLTRRHVAFRVIKLNPECARAFWAGQQQELIYLRNRNPERGSIQNSRPVLRNIINSSADQPIGYPIYVSPLTTSFVETHPAVTELLGAPVTPAHLLQQGRDACVWLRRHVASASGGHSACAPPAAAAQQAAGGQSEMTMSRLMQAAQQSEQATESSKQPTAGTSAGKAGRSVRPGARAAEMITGQAAVGALSPARLSAVALRHSPRSSILSLGRDGRVRVSLDGFHGGADDVPEGFDSPGTCGVYLQDADDPYSWETNFFVQVSIASQVFQNLNRRHAATMRPVVHWPEPAWLLFGGEAEWPHGWMDNVLPPEGVRARSGNVMDADHSQRPEATGVVVHKWTPFNANSSKRSHTNQTIYLVKLRVRHQGPGLPQVAPGGLHIYVPVAEQGIVVSVRYPPTAHSEMCVADNVSF